MHTCREWVWVFSLMRRNAFMHVEDLQGLLWWSGVKIPHFHCRGCRFDP